MSRTVLAFERFGDDVMLKLDDAPLDVDGLGENERVDVAQVSGNTLVERGEALRELLFTNPAVKAALTAVLAAPPGSAPFPLYFHVRAALADGVPWEEIHAEQGFFALDQRWPIGRIASRARPLSERVFVPPLRIVAILSAAGRSGMQQLRAMLAAMGGDDAAAIGVRLHVISGDESLLDAAVGPNVTRELIAANGPGLVRQITQAKPHLLHVLCHGGVVAGARTLAFAHVADFDAQPPDSPPAPGGQATDVGGSVRLTVPDLVGALLPCDPWLVVLSACQTADPTGAQGGPALAHDVVSGGIPAVVGMRRLVDLGETNRFCRALYPEILATLNAALTPPPAVPDQPAVRSVDWAGVLTGPRKVLGDPDPSQKDSWTDPVLYVQDQPMKIVRWPDSPAVQISPAEYAMLRAKIDGYREYLTRLDPATAAPGLIDELRARIDEMESSLPKARP
jgi:hypothetical protein